MFAINNYYLNMSPLMLPLGLGTFHLYSLPFMVLVNTAVWRRAIKMTGICVLYECDHIKLSI
jgi:hypothetical protein